METKIKTPMQLLFYRIEQLRFANNPIDEIMEIKNEMLEIEKEQIQQAFALGKLDAAEQIFQGTESKDSVQYYKETYGGKSKWK